MSCDYEKDYKCGDGEFNLLKKILGRLKELVGLADPPGGGSTVTLTVSDIEIGAVEIKDGDTDARARIITTCPDPADRGLVVRNIPCGTQAVSGGVDIVGPLAAQPAFDSVSVVLASDHSSLPLPVGAATDATLLDWLPSIYGAVISTNDLLNTRLVQGPNTMEFSLSVTMASDQPAIPVSGPLTDTELRALAVPVGTKTPLTASAPSAASVGVASAQVLASNASRKGLVLTNTSTSTISFGFGAPAVLGSGITLLPGNSFSMDEYSFYTGAINAIALGAASNLAIQQFTT